MQRSLLPVREVAKLTELPIHTLHYWERMFKEFLAPHRSRGGQRRYRVSDIEKILEIKRLLREEGYSIAGAQRILLRRVRSGELPFASHYSEFNWHSLAQKITELLLERLSREIPHL